MDGGSGTELYPNWILFRGNRYLSILKYDFQVIHV